MKQTPFNITAIWIGGRVWFIAPVLKTGVPKGTMGPNPILSSIKWAYDFSQTKKSTIWSVNQQGAGTDC